MKVVCTLPERSFISYHFKIAQKCFLKMPQRQGKRKEESLYGGYTHTQHMSVKIPQSLATCRKLQP